MADFYPVAQGAENSISVLADKVIRGYSIVVFPEGTRSVDGDIKRFHKGAFYLAEQLNIDIAPILIHGTGYTMTKGDFLLKDGTITIKYLPRIKPDDISFGANYTERTKLISRYFKEEYKKLSTEVEQPAYFKEQLIYNYLYKGPILEWTLRLQLRREKNYQYQHELVPMKGQILHLGCGNGALTYLLHFASKDRKFTGVDIDEEQIATANNCFNKDSGINFVQADALEFAFDNYDAILVTGMLLRRSDQKLLMEKCIHHLNPGGMIIVKDVDINKSGVRSADDFTGNLSKFKKENAAAGLSVQVLEELAASYKMKVIMPGKAMPGLVYMIQNA
jgi:2-polyprenyl-3-methyl-5-hydroxy-6-metoxy-1,4-benzoquinol methylase